jgi:peptidyl-prolyl cis-trans isomerase D
MKIRLFCLAVFIVAFSVACVKLSDVPFAKRLFPTPTVQDSVVTVNGESLPLREFRSRVIADRQSLINQYYQYEYLAQAFNLNADTDPQISPILKQITAQLDDPTGIGSQVIDAMIDDLLIRQYARSIGITVTEADVEALSRENFRYFPKGTPTPTTTSTPFPYPTFSSTQLAMVTVTPSPVAAPRTPVSTPRPTPTKYTQSAYQAQYKEVLVQYTGLGLSEAEVRKIFFESELYRTRVKDIVTRDVARVQEQVWARHILVADQAAAQSLYDQLLHGADFASLASQYSNDAGNKANGGDLGWFGKGVMVAEFEQAAFTLPVGTISQPVKSKFGWHILQVLGHENRPLSDDRYQAVLFDAMKAWLAEQRAAATVVISDKWKENIPTTPGLSDAAIARNATATAYSKTLTP